MSAARTIPAPGAIAPPTFRRVALLFGLACLCLVATDAVLFRTRLYPSILEPDSTTGTFEMVLFREREFLKTHPGDNLVLTFGDSRFAYAPRLANEITPQTGLVFRHGGIGGTDARTWYYMLRDLDPDANRYRAVVLGVTDYDDQDEAFNPLNDIRALHYVAVRLRWSDIPGFAFSFQDPQLKWEAFRGALLKGIVLQNDLYQFLAHPLDRIRYVKLTRRGYEGWTYDYVETDKSVAGLDIDWHHWTAKYPPSVDQNVRDTVEHTLMAHDDPHDGRVARFRREWFGRIIDRYRGSRTKVIILRLPRGPILRPPWLEHPTSSSIREFRSRPNVLLANEHAFEPLEQPPLFKDALHLNRVGVAWFSRMLAVEIQRVLKDAHAL